MGMKKKGFERDVVGRERRTVSIRFDCWGLLTLSGPGILFRLLL